MELKNEFKDTQLGIIPNEWNLLPLKSVSWYQEGPGLRNWQFRNNGIKVINVTNLENGILNLERTDRHISWAEFHRMYEHFEIDENDIVVASSGNSYGKVAVVRKQDLPLLMNTSVIRFKPLPTIDFKYLLIFLKSIVFKKQIDLLITGGAQPNFGPFHLNKVFITLPESVHEQTAIASALYDMDELITQTEIFIQKKKAIKQGVMQELLRPKEGWENVAIRDIAKVGRGRVISNKEISKSIEELYPVYSSQTTNNGIMGFIDSFDFEGEYITWTTDGEKAGTVFYRNGRFNCTNVCGTIKLKNYNAKFIAYVLAIESPKHVSRNLANPKLMNEPMKNVRITIPVNINEQEDIANTISNFENEIEALEVKYNKLKLQKQGMMQALLTGKIRLI